RVHHLVCSLKMGVTGTIPDQIIRFEVDNLSTLSEIEQYSNYVTVRGVPWYGEVVLDGNLYVYLNCALVEVGPWSIDVDSEFTLVNSDTTNNIIIKETGVVSSRSKYIEYS
ncbi:hypothetical protein PMAYCL1PPCAC_24881, partial [Pristionchus mayeri]